MEFLRRTLEEFDPKLLKRSKLVEVEGTSLLDNTAANLDLLRNFKAQPNDLLICTYPKAGTTWMQEIVDMLQHGGNKQKCARGPIYERIPFIDMFPMKPVSSVAWGSWFDHVQDWWKAKDHHPILYLFYEDIKEDPAREIKKVAHFLSFELPDPLLKEIIEHTKFETMKNNPMANYTTRPAFVMNQAMSPFMRKGIVGNWKEHLTVAQNERIDEISSQLLAGSGLVFRTE
ncbi:hypothetical protein E2320_003127, partial [Naja naja]